MLWSVIGPPQVCDRVYVRPWSFQSLSIAWTLETKQSDSPPNSFHTDLPKTQSSLICGSTRLYWRLVFTDDAKISLENWGQILIDVFPLLFAIGFLTDWSIIHFLYELQCRLFWARWLEVNFMWHLSCDLTGLMSVWWLSLRDDVGIIPNATEVINPRRHIGHDQ